MTNKKKEKDHQKLIIKFCRKMNIPIWASASGLYCPNHAMASELRAMGIIAEKGEPDLFIPIVKRKDGVIISGGLFIELKREGGKASDEQLKKIAHYNNSGYVARVIEGADKAIEFIQEYLKT